MRILILAGIIVGGFQDEDPARWIPSLSAKEPAVRDEAFIRLLKMGDKAAGALKAAADPRAKDVLALIERRSEQLFEILGRTRDEAGASLDRLLWRSYHICAALCSEREWVKIKPIFEKARCVERDRMRDHEAGLKLTYGLFNPVWTCTSGAKFNLNIDFWLHPEPSVDEPTRVLMRGLDVQVHLHSREKLSNLVGADGVSKDTVLATVFSHPTDPEYTIVRSASLHGMNWAGRDSFSAWEPKASIILTTSDRRKSLTRGFERKREEGEIKGTRLESEYAWERPEDGQGSITRIEPPHVDEPWGFDRYKPADCRTAYGPGDFKTLPEGTKGLTLWGEGILQRDFDRISKCRGLTYLEFEGWKQERRIKLDVLRDLPDLETLIIHRFPRSGVPHLVALKRLKALEIRNGQDLKEEDLVRLAELPSLVELELGDSPGMTDGVLKAWTALKQLRRLKWSGREAAVTNEGLSEMGKLENLEKLTFYVAKAMTGEGYEHLTGLKKLRELSIGYSGVDDRTLSALGRIRTLQEVWIYGGDAVTDEGLMKMSGLPNLSYLYVQSKSTTEKGWRALRDKLPGRWKDRSAFD